MDVQVDGVPGVYAISHELALYRDSVKRRADQNAYRKESIKQLRAQQTAGDFI